MQKVPVLILAFNRADHVAQSMSVLREYKPERLYLECDGPRHGIEGELEAVNDVRRTMLDCVDWPCEVHTLFREENMGCAQAVNDAISWFFRHERWGVIIEDDVLVSQDFFYLCENLLPRYKDEERIMEISAECRVARDCMSTSYTYSLCYRCWGWATWSRAWAKMDMSMSGAKRVSLLDMFRRLGFFQGVYMFLDFKRDVKHLETFNSWATRWFLSILDNDGLVIVPRVNMAINLGMSGGAHFRMGDEKVYAHIKMDQMERPIVFNDRIEVDKIQKRIDSCEFNRIRIAGLRKKLRRMFAVSCPSHS